MYKREILGRTNNSLKMPFSVALEIKQCRSCSIYRKIVLTIVIDNECEISAHMNDISRQSSVKDKSSYIFPCDE